MNWSPPYIRNTHTHKKNVALYLRSLYIIINNCQLASYVVNYCFEFEICASPCIVHIVKLALVRACGL